MNTLKVAAIAVLAFGTVAIGQQRRPLSPDGVASAQVGGKWVKAERDTAAMGGEQYQGGKWIDITYGRPLTRGRQTFTGTGADYGKAMYGGAPVWRAGANVSTRLKTEITLTIGGKTVPAGEHSLFIELKSPSDWTFIVSNWGALQQFGPSTKDALYGAFDYTPDKDVTRAAMKVEALPFAVEQLTWSFVDMTATGGRMAIMWGKAMGSVPFTFKPE